ncbi:MAG TPA: hypothetical protein VEY07_02190, partial [Thermoplasmata archaeon]|nr:hypothetical protein [Thermoplasmata archaeon]
MMDDTPFGHIHCRACGREMRPGSLICPRCDTIVLGTPLANPAPAAAPPRPAPAAPAPIARPVPAGPAPSLAPPAEFVFQRHVPPPEEYLLVAEPEPPAPPPP